MSGYLAIMAGLAAIAVLGGCAPGMSGSACPRTHARAEQGVRLSGHQFFTFQ